MSIYIYIYIYIYICIHLYMYRACAWAAGERWGKSTIVSKETYYYIQRDLKETYYISKESKEKPTIISNKTCYISKETYYISHTERVRELLGKAGIESASSHDRYVIVRRSLLIYSRSLLICSRSILIYKTVGRSLLIYSRSLLIYDRSLLSSWKSDWCTPVTYTHTISWSGIYRLPGHFFSVQSWVI